MSGPNERDEASVQPVRPYAPGTPLVAAIALVRRTLNHIRNWLDAATEGDRA